MNILYDYQSFGRRFGGIARYHYELLKGLQRNEHDGMISTIFSECEYILNDAQFNVLNPFANKRFFGSSKMSEVFEIGRAHV